VIETNKVATDVFLKEKEGVSYGSSGKAKLGL
jgi:hypothetical protein